MKKSLTETLKVQDAAKQGWSSEAGRNMPVFKGDVFKFTGRTGIVCDNEFYPNGEGVPHQKDVNYPAFETDSNPISFSQIARNRNGLGLSGTRAEMLSAFADMFTDEGLTVKIADVKTKSAIYDGNESTSNYLFFTVQ